MKESNKISKRKSTFQDLTHQKFGRLTVLSYAGKRGRSHYWQCVCTCAEKSRIEVSGDHLRSGHTKSCGCYKREVTSKHKKTHGNNYINSPEYRAWRMMKNRCLNPRADNYRHYGARGITVCAEWANSFEAFLSDMGRKPGADFSLERINNDLGYSATNCKWATKQEQSLNTRRTVYIAFNGARKTLVELSALSGIAYSVLYKRIVRRKWHVAKAISIPIKRSK